MECKNCGNLLNENSLFCAKCGTKAGEGERQEIEIATCPSCNRLTKAENRFCPHCGAVIKKKEACVTCGRELDEGAKFCPQCGTKTGESSSPAEPRQESNPVYNQPMQPHAPVRPVYEQPVYTPPVNEQSVQKPRNVSKKNSVLSMAFGIASLFCGLFSWYYICPFIFIAGSIIFGSLSNSKREAYIREAGEQNGFTRAGKITTTISIPVTIVLGIIGVIVFSLFVYTIAKGFNS